MFKAARVQEHLGVGVWGHIYPGWQKAWRYVKVFTFVFLARWGSLIKNQEDCPNYLALKDHSNKLKMPGRNILQFFFFLRRELL